MCRILGYIGQAKVTPHQIKAAIQKQINGGPDAQEVVQEHNWALGNNRLIIQGIDGGEQPYKLKKYTAVFNGEIYNHRDIKKDLVSRGYNVDSCDGSVILPLYDLYGENFVNYIDGMYSIAIIDETDELKLVLVVDNQAIKSLFYSIDHETDTLYFASEIDALKEFPIGANIRKESLNEYLIGRSIWGNKTFFSDIEVMGPSSTIIKTIGIPVSYVCRSKRHCENIKPISNMDSASRHLSAILDEEVKKMLQADVPVCLVTSGGLDSSLITAIAAKYQNNIECFNVAYEGSWPSDERKFAIEIAKKYGAKYNQIMIPEKDFPRLLDLTIKHLGQPNSAPHSLSTYALFEAIHAEGYKVAMTGEGADEVFGGYARFRDASLSKELNWHDNYFDKMCATTKSMRGAVYSDEYKNFINSYDDLLEESISIIESIQTKKDRLHSILEFDRMERFPSYILRRVDHLSMANSVEVRVPFCQDSIISFSSRLPSHLMIDEKNVKKVLYKVAEPYLPASILNRPKQPFTLPIVNMLSKGHILYDLMVETLTSSKFINRGMFNSKYIKKLIEQQTTKPNGDTANMLWSIMVFERWITLNNY